MALDERNLPAVIRAADARRAGLESVVRGSAFVRAARGVYVPVGTDLSDPDVRIAVAAAGLPPSVVLGGWAAARLHERAASDRQHGAPLVTFDGTDGTGRGRPQPVLLCAPPRTRLVPGEGRRLLRSIVPPEERTVLGGLPVTGLLRTAFDLARLADRTAAVAGLDRFRALGLLEPDQLARMIALRPRWRGVDAARAALGLSADGVESPRESVLRLLWLDTGLAAPWCNAVIHDLSGRFVARVDLLDPQLGLVGEYDGSYHSSAARRSADSVRHEQLEMIGITVVRATAADLASSARRRSWQQRLLAARRRAEGAAAEPRRWRATPTRSR
ncbi:hypothetical protein [Cellulomonas hominis]